ncbi:unnamed protein product [Prorocentrum cordatum]|uniref:Uncharacterized protein n=1 Tax=Prorocentrum cordatum TaxID=2364126 RepID=A0ABN9P9F4_9DINO|nr:unnamed protein product [Polarella glacialis]
MYGQLFFSVSCPIHTDIEWDTYLSDGFQVWYLVHNEDCLGTGATCSSSRRTGCRRPAPRRCGWRGTASSRYSPPPARAAPPRRWTRPSCAPGTWTSGDMRPGECLVMSAGAKGVGSASGHEGLRGVRGFRMLALVRAGFPASGCVPAASPRALWGGGPDRPDRAPESRVMTRKPYGVIGQP